MYNCINILQLNLMLYIYAGYAHLLRHCLEGDAAVHDGPSNIYVYTILNARTLTISRRFYCI